MARTSARARTPYILSTLVLVGVLLGMSLTGGAPFPDSTSASAAAAASTVRYVVGYHQLGILPLAGDGFFGATIVEVEEALRFLVVDAPPAWPPLALTLHPNVRYIEEESSVETQAESMSWGAQRIGAPEAWATTLGHSGTSAVCVIDSGVRSTHEDLVDPPGINRWKGGYNYVSNNGNVNDNNGHGTHVQGIAVAWTGNGLGLTGIANVDYYHVKVLNSQGVGSSINVAKAIKWCADNGPARTVINLSLGGAGGSGVERDAAKYAYYQRGALVVAAAGNYGCEPCIVYPAAHPEVIAVTCTNDEDQVCSFSSRGPQAELSAPGTAIANTCNGFDSNYCMKFGTSMSSPHVAGAAALVWHQNPALTNSMLRDCLRASATTIGQQAIPDNSYGFGRLDVSSAMATCGSATGPFPAGACFVVSPEKIGATDTLWQVDAYCSNLGNTTLEYRWDWEGNEFWTEWYTSSQSSHQYTAPGVRTIQLEVRTPENETARAYRPIIVNELPVACIRVDGMNGGVVDTFRFSAACSDGAITVSPRLMYRFDTTGGYQYAHQDWSHDWSTTVQFGSTGTKTVRVEVRDEFGWKSNTTINVVVQTTARQSPSSLVEFVAVPNGGKTLIVSSDGLNWQPVQLVSLTTPTFWDIAHSGSRWVAVSNSAAPSLWTSTNGLSWTSSSPNQLLRSVDYGGGVWVVVGEQGWIGRSTEGTSWTWQQVGTQALKAVAYGNGAWLAVRSSDSGVLRSLNGGQSWTLVSYIPTWIHGFCDEVVYASGKWLASCGMGGVYSSEDGVDWTDNFFAHRIANGLAEYGQNVWAAVGASSVAENLPGFATSDDGVLWRPRPGPVGQWNLRSFHDAAYNGHIGRWVAVGGNSCSAGPSWAVESFDGYGWWEGQGSAGSSCALRAVAARK